ncbi:zeta toxin family protein [Deinococcus fonticola]|uniref:zeta toxin family protein n=1 Tax=Deinococcus fonticola TaxID=2528713 RepID=UPI001074BFB2|nr:zeta toxin family protein [Deinococcus fonticola]
MPTLTVIAGQNGSGKSTLVKAQRLKTIDPDQITRSYGQGYTTAANLQAGREAVRQQNEAITNGQSFGIETTLSSRQPIVKMEEAREAGYKVKLAFVIPENDNTRLRIDNRVNEGGHNISDVDLERRRPRIVENLPQAMKQANMTALYLSNTETRDFRLVGAAYNGEVKLTPEVPEHIQATIKQHFDVQQVDSISPHHPITHHFQPHVQQRDY